MIVQGVAGEKGGLGYFGFSYFEENQDSLTAVEIDGGDGCVAPSVETAQNGDLQAALAPALHLREDRNRSSGRRSRRSSSTSSTTRRQIAESSQFVPLTDEQLTKAKSDFEAAVAGAQG